MTRTSLGHHLGTGLGLGLVLALGAAVAHADLANSQPRSVGAFHAIDLAGTLEVQVTLGKAASVTVTADGDLADEVDKVITRVKDGVLMIETPDLKHRKVKHGHLRAIVTAPDLDALSISGTGAMKVTGIANDRLAINLGGTGALTAAGSTGALRVEVGGTGEVAARDLTARDVVVEIGGTGSARVNASHTLDARVTGTGSIHVGGHPTQVKKSVSGLGSIHVDR